LAERTAGAALSVVGMYAMQRHGIIAALGLDRARLVKFLAAVEAGPPGLRAWVVGFWVRIQGLVCTV
jgi:hypothetical protein